MDDSTLRDLLLTPPDAFVAARNALAKSLKQDGRREHADEVAALRRPGWTDWALNAAADADPDAVAAFADAADTMRAAQAEALAGRGSGVADALRAVRRLTTEFARRADRELTGRGRGSELAALVERLTTVAASEAATDRLRRAVLRDGDESSDDIPAEPPPPPAPSRAVPARAARAERVKQQAATARAERAERAEAAEAAAAAERAATRRELMRAVAERERAQRTTDHHVARAEHTLAEAETKRDLAAAAVARAQAELDRATERAESAAATVAELRAVADAEAAALAELRTRLDALGR